MKRASLCCLWLWILHGCVPSGPPLLVFPGAPAPETVIAPQQARAYPESAPAPSAPAVPDFTTRVRIFNDYNTVSFKIWIDPTEFDGEGNPLGAPFWLFPLLDPNLTNPRERIFRLAPGPHRVYFKSFYPTDYHGARPRQNGWLDFRVIHRDDPCHICLEISTRSFR